MSSSYFFLFFGLPPIFSYFFTKFLSFSYFFRASLGTQKHFEIFEIRLPIKLINSTKIKLHIKRSQCESFMSDFLLKLVPRLNLSDFNSMQGILGGSFACMYMCHVEVAIPSSVLE